MTSAGATRKRGEGLAHSTGRAGSRDLLLEEATQQFATKGYEAVSLAVVAKNVGLAQSSIYYHFPDKLELWKACVRRVMRNRRTFFPVSELITRDVDPVLRLRIFLRSMIHANIEDPIFGRIFLHEALADSDRQRWLIETYVLDAIAILESVLNDGIEQGLIRRMPIGILITLITNASFVGQNYEFVVRQLDSSVSERPSTELLVHSMVEATFNGLVIAPTS